MADNKPDPKIIIIGAGIAGLSAAHDLVQNGFNNVTVLEASDRIGGRIHTVEFGDGLIELGANWIHGVGRANSVYTLAKQKGLITEPYEFLDRQNVSWRTNTGREIDRDLAKEAFDLFEKIEDELENGITEKESLSCEQYIEMRLDQELKNRKEDDRKDIFYVCESMSKAFGLFVGDDENLISANLYFMGDVISEDDLTLHNGYLEVVKCLDQELPKDAVRLEKKVTKIIWDEPNGGAKIFCDDDHEFQNGIVCDHVIVTCSLGHLKEHHKKLFQPELPKKKINAIEQFGFGKVEAIFLSYDKPFWKKGEGDFVITLENHDESIPFWLRSAYWVREIPTANNVLLIWVYGQSCTIVSSLSKSEISAQCTKFISKGLNRNDIPTPSDVLVSSWGTNPLFLGAYCYFSMDSSETCVANIARPISINSKPVICFAGEATDEKYFSYAHGGRSSGIREAKRIIQLYR